MSSNDRADIQRSRKLPGSLSGDRRHRCLRRRRQTGVLVPGERRENPGGIGAQTRQTMKNLKQSVEAAGATMDDVVQVQVFLSDAADFQEMNTAYAEFFNAPYPVRATFTAGIIVPGARIEILAQADVSHVK